MALLAQYFRVAGIVMECIQQISDSTLFLCSTFFMYVFTSTEIPRNSMFDVPSFQLTDDVQKTGII